jgi:predicted metalloprotease with PDZ domain
VSRDAWLFEGLPTYLQNVLMARGGATSAEEAWLRLRTGFRRGARTAPNLSLAQANERYGIGGTYLRVYWAGAALMLAADLRLRSETGGQHSLDTALEQLSRCCASEQRRWSAQEIIARLDAVTGTTVFSEVTRDQFDAAGFPDYDALLARAGVKVEGVRVQFDAAAPWAREREALMHPSGLAQQADGIKRE